MCVTDVRLMNVAETEVLRWMRAGETFTALDISNALKRARFPFRHREVAGAVRDIHAAGAMRPFGYRREVITVLAGNGAQPVQAALYLPNGADAEDYADRSQNALLPVPAHEARDLSDRVAAGPLGVLAGASRVGPRRGAGTGRQDGAVAISRRLLAQLGWAEGDRLALTPDADGLRIAVTPGAGLASGWLRIWSGRRLRVCKTKLRLGALSADRVTVEVSGDALRLVPKP